MTSCFWQPWLLYVAVYDTRLSIEELLQYNRLSVLLLFFFHLYIFRLLLISVFKHDPKWLDLIAVLVLMIGRNQDRTTFNLCHIQHVEMVLNGPVFVLNMSF